MTCIYKIESPTGRMYIGKTTNLERRITLYKGAFCKDQRFLYNSIVKHGWENHTLTIIAEFPEDISEAYLFSQEEIYIYKYKSNCNKFPDQRGLNLTDGGEGSKGFKWTPESRERLSSAMKGKMVGEKNSMFGKKMSDEVRLKISNALSGDKHPFFGLKGEAHPLYGRVGADANRYGIKHSEESLEKMRGENHWAYGKKQSKETIELKIAAIKGKKRSAETIKKISGGNHWNYGLTRSKETAAKISNSIKRGNHPSAKRVVDIESNIIYNCVVDAADAFGLNYSTLKSRLNGSLTNNTSLKFL